MSCDSTHERKHNHLSTDTRTPHHRVCVRTHECPMLWRVAPDAYLHPCVPSPPFPYCHPQDDLSRPVPFPSFLQNQRKAKRQPQAKSQCIHKFYTSTFTLPSTPETHSSGVNSQTPHRTHGTSLQRGVSQLSTPHDGSKKGSGRQDVKVWVHLSRCRRSSERSTGAAHDALLTPATCITHTGRRKNVRVSHVTCKSGLA